MKLEETKRDGTIVEMDEDDAESNADGLRGAAREELPSIGPPKLGMRRSQTQMVKKNKPVNTPRKSNMD
jgi:hypothetical protein